MATKITTEMENLEKQKLKFTYLSKFHDLKIQLIKLQQNKEQVEKELSKISKHLENLGGTDLIGE